MFLNALWLLRQEGSETERRRHRGERGGTGKDRVRDGKRDREGKTQKDVYIYREREGERVNKEGGGI